LFALITRIYCIWSKRVIANTAVLDVLITANFTPVSGELRVDWTERIVADDTESRVFGAYWLF
jgi:hypothetical protein